MGLLGDQRDRLIAGDALEDLRMTPFPLAVVLCRIVHALQSMPGPVRMRVLHDERTDQTFARKHDPALTYPFRLVTVSTDRLDSVSGVEDGPRRLLQRQPSGPSSAPHVPEASV